MTVRMSVGEARRLGLPVSPEPTRSRTTRKQVTGKYVSLRCHACGATFTSQAAEDRHVTLEHSRFEFVL